MTDAMLLHQFATHQSQSAFEQLVDRHGAMVHGVALRITRSRADADDVVQEVFLNLARKAGRVKWRTSLAGWLHHAAQCAAISHQRKASRRRRHELAAHGPDASTTHDPSPADQEAAQLLDRELAALPEKYRAPIVLHHLEQMKYDQAAQRLGCNENTFAVRLRRGRHLLRDRLARRGLALPVASLFAWLDQSTANASAVNPTSLVPWPQILGATNAMKPTNGKLVALLTLIVSILGAGSFAVIYRGLADTKPSQTKTLADKQTRKPQAQEQLETKPVAKGPLEYWIELPKKQFAGDQLFSLELKIKNTSKKNVILRNANWLTSGNYVLAQPVGAKGHYRLDLSNIKAARQLTTDIIKPGTIHTVQFKGGNDYGIRWVSNENIAGGVLKNLPADTYDVSVHWVTGPQLKAVQQGTETVGGVRTKSLRIYFGKEEPEDQNPLQSTPTTKNGLQAWLELEKNSAKADGDFQAKILYKNQSKKLMRFQYNSPLTTYYQLTYHPKGKKGYYHYGISPQTKGKRSVEVTALRPGETLSVDKVMLPTKYLRWIGPDQDPDNWELPLVSLPPGDYQLRVIQTFLAASPLRESQEQTQEIGDVSTAPIWVKIDHDK